jgi:hypothetical protein
LQAIEEFALQNDSRPVRSTFEGLGLVRSLEVANVKKWSRRTNKDAMCVAFGNDKGAVMVVDVSEWSQYYNDFDCQLDHSTSRINNNNANVTFHVVPATSQLHSKLLSMKIRVDGVVNAVNTCIWDFSERTVSRLQMLRFVMPYFSQQILQTLSDQVYEQVYE